MVYGWVLWRQGSWELDIKRKNRGGLRLNHLAEERITRKFYLSGQELAQPTNSKDVRQVSSLS